VGCGSLDPDTDLHCSKKLDPNQNTALNNVEINSTFTILFFPAAISYSEIKWKMELYRLYIASGYMVE
jgi:hypothetical protein